jgi:hypothetical protein
MCEAGLGDMAQFRRSAAHRLYLDQAIRARDGEAQDAAFAAYDAGEAPLVPGDLLCRSRRPTDYRELADRRREFGTGGATHCDIVVKIEARNNRALVIGGNVFQSVSLSVLPLLTERGRFPRPVDDSVIEGAQTVFAHLKLRAPAIGDNALDRSPTLRGLPAR